MERTGRKSFCAGFVLIAAFALWTVIVCNVDVQAIGPMESEVGLASVNAFFHDMTGVNWRLYTVTDWLGIVPVFTGAMFALVGLGQWIRRRIITKVDRDILMMGVFYVLVAGAYVMFEKFAVNYRPVLIDGNLEASYPSSTTLMVICVMPTAVMPAVMKTGLKGINRAIRAAVIAFTGFMVIGRLISGVHWLSDIVGGMLLGAGLDAIYYSLTRSGR